jgi:hypothetical protein
LESLVRLVSLSPFALLALVACSDAPADDAQSGGGDVEALVEPTTRVIDARPGVDVEVRDDALVFPAPLRDDVAGAGPGDVLVSGHGEGFCRRVTGRHEEGGRIVVTTEPAGLTDVFRQARVATPTANVTPSLTPQRFTIPLPTLGIAGVRLPVGGEGSDVTIEEGSYSLTPSIDYDLVVRDRRVESMKLVVGGAMRSTLKVKYNIARPPYVGNGVTVHYGAPGKTVLAAQPHYELIWVGSVPVVLVIRVELLAGFLLEVGGDVSGDSSLTTDGHIDAGVSYDGAWHDLSTSRFSVHTEGAPSFASSTLGGDVTLTARLSVSVYGAIGPWVGLQGYAGIGRESGKAAEQGAADVYGEIGLRGLVGVEAAPFGKALVGYQSVLFDENLHFPIVATP